MFNFFQDRELLYKKIILNNDERKIIIDYIIENEDKIKSLGPDIYDGTREDSLTGRFYLFNYLNVPEINEILIPKFKKIFKKLKIGNDVYVQCWANTYKKDDYINPHKHSNGDNKNFLSANIFLTGNLLPGVTYFFEEGKNIKDINNKFGEITIFKSDLIHGVKPYEGTDIRITMGLDIHFNNLGMDFSDKNRYYKI